MPTEILECPEQLDQETGRRLHAEVAGLRLDDGDTLMLDFSDTSALDPRGAAWLVRIADSARGAGAELQWRSASDEVERWLDLLGPSIQRGPAKPPRSFGPFEKAGDVAYKAAGEIRDMANLVADAVYWTAIAPFEGRGFRWSLFIDELHEMGVRAVAINCLMNFLLGLTIAMMSAAQLRDFGLDIYVADLIMIGFARELAPIMTAVVVSARTGAAIAAEISTMKVQEEIDALRGMGINVPQYLIAPKLLALLLAMPCLVMLGLLSGIAGGAVWGIFVLDFRLDLWLNETINAAQFDDLFQGLLKCLFFAAVIVYVGCHNGLRVEGGSRGVGLMTTRSVVMDIFFIVLIDMLFAAVFYYVLD